MTDGGTGIHPAPRYEPAADLWTITCLFNPAGWRSKLDNYERFARPFREGGLPLVTVDCAIGESDFALPAASDVIRVRSRSPLWQKERLLNIAVSRLPPAATKVAWIDGDVLFSNPSWAVETSRGLDTVSALQPYSAWHRLPRGHLHHSGQGRSGVCFAHGSRPEARAAGPAPGGMPDFAWAARRSLLDRHGLYDACIIGGGDHAIAHAINGSLETSGVRRIFGVTPSDRRPLLKRAVGHAFDALGPRNRFRDHFRRWAEAIRADVTGPIDCVGGDLLHLWHGSIENRRYADRHRQMRRFAFDPERDLWRNDDDAWEWSPKRDDMRQWAAAYFQSRREDD